MTVQKTNKKINVQKKRCGTVQQKVLLLLLAGVAFGLSRNPKQQWKIITSIPKELEKLGPNVNRSVKKLHESNLVKKKINTDGTTTLVLTEKGKKYALTYDLEKMKLPKYKKWDKKWRIVLYDIPEELRKGRVILGETLKRIGMFELQKSVYIYPFECRKEVNYIIELYNLKKYVRYIEATAIDNEDHIRKEFKIR